MLPTSPLFESMMTCLELRLWIFDWYIFFSELVCCLHFECQDLNSGDLLSLHSGVVGDALHRKAESLHSGVNSLDFSELSELLRFSLRGEPYDLNHLCCWDEGEVQSKVSLHNGASEERRDDTIDSDNGLCGIQ